mgnify:CR=1 FL=1
MDWTSLAAASRCGVHHRRGHRVSAEGEAPHRVVVPLGRGVEHHLAHERRGHAVEGDAAQERFQRDWSVDRVSAGAREIGGGGGDRGFGYLGPVEEAGEADEGGVALPADGLDQRTHLLDIGAEIVLCAPEAQGPFGGRKLGQAVESNGGGHGRLQTLRGEHTAGQRIVLPSPACAGGCRPACRCLSLHRRR